jgi:hypothetical protein
MTLETDMRFFFGSVVYVRYSCFSCVLCCFIIFEVRVLTVTNILLIKATLRRNYGSLRGYEIRMDGFRT